MKRPCPECSGVGFGVQSKDPDIEWHCPECGGTGICRGCNLPGHHPPHMPSPRCEYAGTIDHCTCPKCWG